MSTLPFVRRLSFAQRRAEFDRISTAQPTHIPVIVQAATPDCPRTKKEKFLLPHSLTGAQLAFVLRKHLQMESTQALFVTCGGCLVPAQESVQVTYARHKDDDGFLYVTYALENAFGSVS
jgi:surfactin synthase thioesterase subunit